MNKNYNIMDIADMLDDEYIIEASPVNAQPYAFTFPRKKNAILVVAAICTLLFAIISISLTAPLLKKKTPSPIPPPATETKDIQTTPPDETTPPPKLPEIPVFPNAQFTAEDMAKMFTQYDYLEGTNNYTMVYVPSADYLNISKLPTGDSIEVYDINDTSVPLNEKDFVTATDGILGRFCVSNGIPVPKYEYKIESLSGSLSYGVNSLETERYYIYVSQTQNYYNFSIYLQSNEREKGIYLGNELVSVDQTKNDEDILSSLESIREKLFNIFGCSFSDAKIVRSFDSYGEHGAESICVYYYNKSSLPFSPILDYIQIYFDNHPNYKDDIVSDDVLRNAKIIYRTRRNTSTEKYTLSSEQKLISLADAESLLYNGYVFGNHVCPLCMAEQSAVSFYGYEYVEIEYFSSTVLNKTVPFYSFYKKIGKAKNGNDIYANTYVPAIEISGYTEYFESQTKKHRQTFFA